MKQQFFLIICFFQIYSLACQTSLHEIDLDYGKYHVGFRHYVAIDSSRTYSRVYDYSTSYLERQIPISLWYPGKSISVDKKSMNIAQYFEVLKEEEEWEYLPNDQVLNWFYYQNTDANRDHLEELTKAYKDIDLKRGKFPVILYTPSFQASSVENFALCEYLASHGYIVISSPSRGATTRWMTENNEQNMETQARDVEFLILEAAKISTCDLDQMAVLGFSFGGLSNLVVQMRNERIKAVASLDGTERYQDVLLKKSPFFDPLKVDIPYMHMAQKRIPDLVLKEDGIDAALNTQFNLFDQMVYSDRYKLKFHNLTHSYFSSFGVLFEKRDPRQDKSDDSIMESYKLVCAYSFQFLNAYLKRDQPALAFINGNPENNGVAPEVLTVETKLAKERPYVFSDFNVLASDQDYNDLDELYKKTLQKSPSLKLQEGDLNTLGLQLVFNPEASYNGIKVLLFATRMYPNSANLYDSLAEAYLFIGKDEEAIESFEKSLTLNAQNQNAIKRLKQLRE